MDELRGRFAALDRVAVPDLWSDIDRRVTDPAATSAVQGRVAWRGGRAQPRLSPTLILLLLSLLLALALAIVTVGSQLRDLWTSVFLPAPPPVSTERIEVGQNGAFVPAGLLSEWGGGPAVALSDGRVLLVGGESGHLYDPATWTFVAVEGLPHRGVTAPVLLDDGRVLLPGLPTTDGESPYLAIYDPLTGTSRLIEHQFNVGNYATRLADGKVLLLGAAPTGVGPAPAMILDPATEELSPTGSTIAERTTLVSLSDGRVLALGGLEGTSAELYDPATGTFSETGSMKSQRGGFTATRLANGRVLIVGGYSDTETLASAEVYDPASETFTLTGSMEMPRAGHAAALLLDGRVLVVGGSSEGVRVDAGTFTEIYDPRTGRFSRGPVTNQPRFWATAVSLPQGVLVFGHYPGNVGGNHVAGRTAELFTLSSVERPIGCCPDNPGFISASASAEIAAANSAAMVVPAGALEGAVTASVAISWNWPEGGTGHHGGELSLSDCSEGCSIPISLAVNTVVPQDAVVTVTVDIAYEGSPPPQASDIEVVIDANDATP